KFCHERVNPAAVRSLRGIEHGHVGEIGAAGDKNAWTGGTGIHGDAATHGYATAGACTPAKISGVDQTGRAGQGGINLAHEELAVGLTSSLEGSGGDGKIGCSRSSG